MTAALGWSLSGVLIKSVAMSGPAIAFYRCAVATVFLAPAAWSRRQRLDRACAEVVAAYAATVILLVLATKGTTAANAIFLHYTAPFYVFLLGIPLLGERPGRRDWLCLLVAMGGVVCIGVSAEAADWAGVGYGLGSGLAFALLILLLRRDRGRNPLWVMFVNNAVVALLLLPWVRTELPISRHDLVLMLTMGVVQLAVPYVLFSAAIGRVLAREAALISLLEPLLNPVWVALVVGEVPSRGTLAGGTLVLSALVLRYVPSGRRGRPASPVPVA